MKVKLAAVYGLCGEGDFGVSGAIKLAKVTARRYPGKTYLIGELVHNPHVTTQLKKDGVKVVDNLAVVPAASVVVVKAQGEIPAFFEEAARRGIKTVDATCTMVRTAQKMLRELVASGKKVIYVASDKNHDEARSVCGQVENGVKMVTIDELENLSIKEPAETVLLTQTTLSTLEISESLEKLRLRYPALTLVPNICDATTKRQQAVIELAKEVPVVVVVGASHSSNSNRLKEVARDSGARAYIVDNAGDLQKFWFDGVQSVGVTAGASTPDEILSAVVEKLKSF